MCAKTPRFDGNTSCFAGLANALEELSGRLGLLRLREARATAAARVAEQRELRDQEQSTARFGDRVIHFAGSVFEDPQTDQLVRQLLSVFFAVVATDTDKNAEPRADLPDDLARDRYRRSTHPLNHGPHESWGSVSDCGPMSSRYPDPPQSRPLTDLPVWTEGLTRLLDDAFLIPGTNIRVGFDALLGLVAPGAGDAMTALTTGLLLIEGFKRRVPRVILLRMLLNVLVDAIVGAVPLLGDVFDVFHRASRKNLELLKQHAGRNRQKPGFADYAVVGLALLCLLALIALPVVVGLGLIHLVAALVE